MHNTNKAAVKQKVAVINGPFTSHIGRMVHVFRELLDLGHEIQFWGNDDTKILSEKYGIPFRHIPLDDKYLAIMQEDLKPIEYYTRVFFPMALDQLPHVLKLCEEEQPSLLEANTRIFSGIITSEITGIPVMTHCCSGNSFAQAPEDLYGFCLKGDEPEKLRRMMYIKGREFFKKTDDWYNKEIAAVYRLRERENAVGLCSPTWALAHTIRELSKQRIADLPGVILSGPILREAPSEIDFERYRPYCYLSLGTCPWEKEQIKNRYLKLIATLPQNLNVLIGLGNLFMKEELHRIPKHVFVFDQAPQLAAIKSSEFVVCHGGCQTVHEALFYGKSIIGLPHYAELSEMVNSVEINKAGVRIPLAKINTASVHEAVETITSGEYRTRAEQLSQKLKAADGFTNIVNLFNSIRL